MAQTTHSKILSRMAGLNVDGGSDTPPTGSRAVRLAVTKAANDTVGLVLTVKDMAEDKLQLDDLLATLDADLMLVGLDRNKALVGMVAFDVQLRAALLELQTVGSVVPAAAESRAATGTDKTMCDSYLAALLGSLPDAMAGGDFSGWVDECVASSRIASARTAGLVLADGTYRTLRISVDLGVADREGYLLIVLPPVPNPSSETPVVKEERNWSAEFRTSVSGAPATLLAHLHSFSIPLARAQGLEVGQILPLTGCDVHSVRLLSTDGHVVAEGKLGQMSGKRAVRIQQAPAPQMGEIDGLTGASTAVDFAGLAEADNSDLLSLPDGDMMQGGPMEDAPSGMDIGALDSTDPEPSFDGGDGMATDSVDFDAMLLED